MAYLVDTNGRKMSKREKWKNEEETLKKDKGIFAILLNDLHEG